MNGSLAFARHLSDSLAHYCKAHVAEMSAVEMLVCPNFLHIPEVLSAAKGTNLRVGGQDCSHKQNGAHTGDTSAEMLVDMGCSFVIIGHSERRQDHQERNAVIRSKVESALKAGLHVILCIGETQEEREHDAAESVTASQIIAGLPKSTPADKITLAYEPVWAIGTGLTATTDEIGLMHAHIRKTLVRHMLAGGDDVRILYGGSVKPENAADIIAVQEVSGFLVGGASLKPESFQKIVAAACNVTCAKAA